ncbi:MAG TPA: hypothetical protein VLG40_03590 [Candidatus Saccharimonas sp.]|nr:hypothetical protein [Candidatus Saccharimonas sp.]
MKKEAALTWAVTISGEHPDDIDVYQCAYGEGIEIALTWQGEDGSACTYTITRIARAFESDWLPTPERVGTQTVDTPEGPKRKDPSFEGALLYECEVRSDTNAFEPYKVYSLFVLEYADYVYGKLQVLELSPEVIDELFDTIKARYILRTYWFYSALVACKGAKTQELLLLLSRTGNQGREQLLRKEGFDDPLPNSRQLSSMIRGALVLCKAKVVPRDAGE